MLRTEGHVFVYHPIITSTRLLALPVFPSSPTDPGPYGVMLAVVLDACRIIANNRDGYLVRRDDQQRNPSTGECLVPAGIYTYVVDNDE